MLRITGVYERSTVAGQSVLAFVPYGLPPRDPPLDVTGPVREELLAADKELARADIAADLVPAVDWFLYAFVRKEAVLSSQIEGTQATLLDILSFEASSGAERRADDRDVEEVCNYVDAVNWALGQLRDPGGLPLSVRLLSESHRRMMRGARGAEKAPGEIRRTQNWIGGTRPGNAAFVPAPPQHVGALLSDLERWLHANDPLPPLIRIGLAHAQFETIHPYLDGNGRIGRLLITLLLEHWGLLRQPILYLSHHFRRHRAEYYRCLGAVRTDGDWEGWLRYFLDGVANVASEAVEAARGLDRLVEGDRARILGAAAGSVAALRLHDELPRHPIVSVATVCRLLGTTKPTAAKAIAALESLGVLREVTGRSRDRWFHYAAYLERLEAGTELHESARAEPPPHPARNRFGVDL
jgi:Fic family protein